MYTTALRLIAALSVVLVAVACGGSSTEGTPPADMAAGATADLTGTAGADLAQARDMAMGGGGMRVMVNVDTVTCYTLADRSSNTKQPCGGDVLFLVGANVDLQSALQGGMSLCQLPGTFNSLAEVPTDGKGCQWTDYVEGALGLAKTGLLLQDRGGHHYKWFIVSNTLPTMTFDQSQID